ncbi:acyl carrier protein [Pseudomonas sp. Bc-h]|jgi:acyl carrier protein|uniref:acyl carrier protein n=1 Tax=Pseudomonas sp. Bc-h TaxID=1943632 RepID=UPI0009DB1094|nr:acyl carrier protein [Pseudomonas sp. Bc-h]OQR27074.1 acyl carrier protein [Pseudomonas sp. Bc-h]
MTRNEIETKMREIVSTQLGINSEEIVSEASFVDDLDADSLGSVELVLSVQEEFEISVPDDAVSKIITFKDAIDLIEKLSAK